jgi:hypothetical protein
MNDVDRLQQMEDNWNAGDSIFQALGIQQNTAQKIARWTQREQAKEYYMDEGFPEALAEEFADVEVSA